MSEITPYIQAKVLLAAITLIEYREKKQADIESIAELTTFSVEMVHHLVNKLEEIGAVRRITGPFTDRVAIADEPAVDQLKGKEFAPGIEDEVARFAQQQKAKHADISNLFKGGGEKKKDLFSSIQDRIKSGGKQKKENPLDAIGKKEDEK